MTLEDSIDLFFKKSDCGMNYKEITYCYGMSKMTIANENGDSALYKKMSFVEFLEMICRVADIKYNKTRD